MKDGKKIRARDDILLRNEKSWRRARVGAVILVLVWLVVFFTTFEFSETLKEEKEFSFLIGWFLFWLVIVDWLNLKIRHIESIKYYRNKEEEE